MFKLILFEGKKITNSKLFVIMIFCLVLFVLGYYTFVHINTIKVEELIIEEKSGIPITQAELDEIKVGIDAEEIDPEDQDIIMRQEQLETIIMERELLLQYYKEENWNGIVKKEVELHEPTVESRLYRSDWSTRTWPSLFTQISKLEYDRWLLERDIRPVFPIHAFSWITYYDTYFDDSIVEESVKSFSNKYSSSGIHFLQHITGLIFSIFGALFFLFLFGDIVTKEGLAKNGSIQFLRTQPINRYKILTSKFITVILITFLIFSCLVIISLLLGTVFHYFGDWNYPVLIYGEDNTYNFMNMSTYLLQSFILFFMLLLFTYSLLFFFSLTTKRSLIAVGLTLAILFIGIEISAESILSPLAAYVPFYYFSVTEVMTNELALMTDNFLFSFHNGVLVLGISTLLILLLTAIFTIMQYKYWRS